MHALVLTLWFAALQCWGQGVFIARHIGNTDPITEGFTLSRGGSPLLIPASNDLGLNAWHIGLDTNVDIGLYRRSLTVQDQEALRAGWILSLTLRILEPFGVPTPGIFAKLQTGTEIFPSIRFGAQPDGDPMLQIGSWEYTMEGAGSAYHTYQLKYDADVGSASFWADGSLLLTDIAGSSYPVADFSWGGSQRGPGSAYANWNEVSLWVIPEPSTIALLGLAGLWFAGRAVRQR